MRSFLHSREEAMRSGPLFSCIALVALISAAAAVAQTTPTRLRGTITAIDGKTVTIATREGNPVDVRLADNWAVALVAPVTVADIREGSFVGIASVGTDADRTALEVLVFPDAMKGAGEGHYPWDLQPESMMTNATVSTVASAADGQTLRLDYKGGGTQTIKVKPGTPIVTFLPGDRSDARVGAKVFVGAAKAADGTYSAGRLNVGKDGLTPPM
jgi:endonuclease YncB( thermonuclease family)